MRHLEAFTVLMLNGIDAHLTNKDTSQAFNWIEIRRMSFPSQCCRSETIVLCFVPDGLDDCLGTSGWHQQLFMRMESRQRIKELISGIIKPSADED